MFIVKDDNENNKKTQADIRIIGVGGAGNNMIETMIQDGIKGVQFVAVNTDHQALESSSCKKKIQIGSKLTKGLGAGANPEVGRRASVESYEDILNCLKGADMVFVTAGMGGGTGTGAAPFIAQSANELGILTVGIVTKPFLFEGHKRTKQAKKGISELSQYVDTLIIVPNEKLLGLTGKDTPLLSAFKMTDEVLLQAVKGISELVSVPGLINLDFADIKTVMRDKGMALMGRGCASGSNRVEKALKVAVSSPLLDGLSIKGATGIIVNVTGDSSLSLLEYQKASSFITEMADPSADIIVGTVIDENMKDQLSITVIATGFNQGTPKDLGIISKEKLSFENDNSLLKDSSLENISMENSSMKTSEDNNSHLEDSSELENSSEENSSELENSFKENSSKHSEETNLNLKENFKSENSLASESDNSHLENSSMENSSEKNSSEKNSSEHSEEANFNLKENFKSEDSLASESDNSHLENSSEKNSSEKNASIENSSEHSEEANFNLKENFKSGDSLASESDSSHLENSSIENSSEKTASIENSSEHSEEANFNLKENFKSGDSLASESDNSHLENSSIENSSEKNASMENSSKHSEETNLNLKENFKSEDSLASESDNSHLENSSEKNSSEKNASMENSSEHSEESNFNLKENFKSEDSLASESDSSHLENSSEKNSSEKNASIENSSTENSSELEDSSIENLKMTTPQPNYPTEIKANDLNQNLDNQASIENSDQAQELNSMKSINQEENSTTQREEKKETSYSTQEEGSNQNTSLQNTNKKKLSLREILLSKSKEYKKSQDNHLAPKDEKQINMNLQEKYEELSSPFEAEVQFTDKDLS